MAEPFAAPASGVVRDGAHRLPVRVYYEDTDAVGLVYHAIYLHYAERARTEMLRSLVGCKAGMWTALGQQFVVRNLGIDYVKPARLDDALEVRTRVLERGAASLTVEQVILRVHGASGCSEPEELVRMRVRLACVNEAVRPVRLAPALRAALAALTGSAHPQGGDSGPQPRTSSDRSFAEDRQDDA